MDEGHVVDQKNGNLFSKDTIKTWLALASAFAAIVAWGVRLEVNSARNQTEENHATELLQQKLDYLDIHGTRALSDRITVIEGLHKYDADRVTSQNDSFERALAEIRGRISSVQEQINKDSNELAHVIERQSVNNDAINQLQQRMNQIGGGERGPPAPPRHSMNEKFQWEK